MGVKGHGSTDGRTYVRIAGIPLGKSDASGGIGPKHIVTLTSGFSARCRPMCPISPVEFQLKDGCTDGAQIIRDHLKIE